MTDLPEPISDRTRIAALNCRLCETQTRLGIDVIPSLSLSDRIERLIKLAQHQRIRPRDYHLLMLLREELARQAAKSQTVS